MAPASERKHSIDARSVVGLNRPDVSVVVVTHEHREQIAACLDSLRRLPDATVREVIVVDNASTDGTAEVVASAYREVRLLRGDRRRGFSANANRGAALARGRHLLFLNPDTVVYPGALDLLSRYLDEHPDVGCVGPQLVYADGSFQPSVRHYPDLVTTLVRRTPLRWVLSKSQLERRYLMLDDEPVGGDRDVDWMLGAALLVRREAFADLDGFDEGYRLYCEDIDLCWRMRQRSWGVRHLNDAVVEHALGELTRKRFLTIQTAWHFRSMARFVRLHGIPGRHHRKSDVALV